MAIEPGYKWYIPDPNLGAAYGGAAIIAGGDTAELTPAMLSQRRICAVIGWPSGSTRYVGITGTDSSAVTWIRIPDLLYPALVAAGALTAVEIATVVSVLPIGWTSTSVNIKFQPDPRRWTIIADGDSLTEGIGTTPSDARSTYLGQGISLISGEVITWEAPDYREGYSKSFRLLNTGIGSSSLANTNGSGVNVTYPRVQTLSYNQRFKTLCANSAKVIIVLWKGTNDMDYDPATTGEITWARMQTRVATYRADFPLAKIVVCTAIKRGISMAAGSDNAKIAVFNPLVRAGYAAAGANDIADFEGLVPEVNLTTGDVTNGAIYVTGDQTHLVNGGHAKIATVFRDTILRVTA